MSNKLENIVNRTEEKLSNDHSKIPDPFGRACIKMTYTLLIGAAVTVPSIFIYSGFSDQPSTQTVLNIAGFGMGLHYLAGVCWSAKDIINCVKEDLWSWYDTLKLSDIIPYNLHS